ncbi:hypothetical protein FXW07_12190 [Methanosarcina sp. DH1]|uniref:hypothetical protein n=1 Tax=Methanosarcina sp. DH1 TaxID=2605695 RepID=UPI001E2B4487|nr:hypothetical protein [Methanosarcina sp. DH1]MCC4767358.1 hypothetical protein [Methanosarcina sp. DH1]
MKPYLKVMQKLALQDNRKFTNIRGRHKLASYRRQTSCLKLIFIPSPAVPK